MRAELRRPALAFGEELRETQFWGHYFQVVDTVASIENAYALHYDVNPL